MYPHPRLTTVPPSTEKYSASWKNIVSIANASIALNGVRTQFSSPIAYNSVPVSYFSDGQVGNKQMLVDVDALPPEFTNVKRGVRTRRELLELCELEPAKANEYHDRYLKYMKDKKSVRLSELLKNQAIACGQLSALAKLTYDKNNKKSTLMTGFVLTQTPNEIELTPHVWNMLKKPIYQTMTLRDKGLDSVIPKPSIRKIDGQLYIGTVTQSHTQLAYAIGCKPSPKVLAYLQ